MLRVALLTLAATYPIAQSALAFSPTTHFSSVPTPYGMLECLERSHKALLEAGASKITFNVSPESTNVTGIVGEKSLLSVWCRGRDAIIFAEGEDLPVLGGRLRQSLIGP